MGLAMTALVELGPVKTVRIHMGTMNALTELLDRWLGLHTEPADLSLVQMSLRTCVVFTWGVALVRWGDRRLLGKNAGFDVLLIVVLGSVLSRAVNGQASFFPTLGVSALLIFLHHLLSVATCRWHPLSRWIKGVPRMLIRDGKIESDELARSRMSADDLEENLRLNGNVKDIAEVQEARLERNGTVSVLKK